MWVAGKQDRWFGSADDCHAVLAQAAQELTQNTNVHLPGAWAAEDSKIHLQSTAKFKNVGLYFFFSLIQLFWHGCVHTGLVANFPLCYLDCIFSYCLYICDLLELNAEMVSDHSSEADCLLYIRSLISKLSRDKWKSWSKSWRLWIHFKIQFSNSRGY